MVDFAGVPQFQRFFREAASLDVDKNDLKRYSDFVNRKVNDLLVVGNASASANSRDVIEPYDLPITKGLQENIHRFRRMGMESELDPLLAPMVRHGPLDRELTPETEERLIPIAGGLSMGLAQTFKQVDTKLENPSSEHWERAFVIFDQLL